MKRSLLILLLVLTPVFHSSAQENSIFAPFVSRLKASAGKSSVELVWKDSADVDGPCVIYRHTSEINESNFDEAVKIARVPKDTGFYEDFPPAAGVKYFYLVLTEDQNGTLHKVFIPFRNLTLSGVTISERAKESSPALITALKAWAAEDSIQLSFRCSRPSAELFIYRSTDLIEDQNDLLTANLIATVSGAATGFKDYPVPGISYYYGIIDSVLVKTGRISFKAGENYTVLPVEIPLQTTRRIGLPELPAVRPRPLPYLSLEKGYQTGREMAKPVSERIPDKAVISKDTSEASEWLCSACTLPQEQTPPVDILEKDQSPEKGTERFLLSEIVHAEIANEQYDSAILRLTDLRKVRRSAEMDAAVHFYLGQIRYIKGDYRGAFMEFLLSEDELYLKTRPWLDRVFKKLR